MSSVLFILYRVVGELGAYPREFRGHPVWGANPLQDTISHTRQFGNAYSTLREETGVLGGNP